MTEMSKAAKTALINATGRQGAPTGAVGPAMRELFEAGLIGESGGLTRRGQITRESLIHGALDEAF